jgi:salicylate synthetase
VWRLADSSLRLTPGKARIRTSDPRQVAGIAEALASTVQEPAGTGPAAPEALVRSDPAAYLRAVALAVDGIRAARLPKAVLSRPLPLPGTQPPT